MALQSNKAAAPSRLPSTRSFHGRFEYDVFLSFRGEDTRHNFAGLFHHILELQGIQTFFDEEDLNKGEKIEEILGALGRSKIYVPIFSKGYAESRWCLREVAKMVECCHDGGQERRIIPIFFDVDPTEVRHQTGPFKAAFIKHQHKERRNRVDEWKRALGYVGDISGYHLKNYNGNQRELVVEITAQIQNVLTTKRLLREEEYLVGLDIRIELMMKRLDFEAQGVRVIGIHGIGGAGKTTLAKAVYNKSRHLFQAGSFIENVRDVSKSKGLVHLQQQLVQDISKDKRKKEINSLSEGAKMIEDMVRGKRVLLVLDDVDDHKQLEELVVNINRFHPRSRIIVTTRREKILEGLHDEAVYKLEELDEEEAVRLFNYHAFGDDGPQEEYINLSKEVLSVSNRLPLALQVFGSLFRTAETPEVWKKLLKELRLRQLSEVHEKLRISYESLNGEERIIFLDIACLLVGKNVEGAISTWEGHKLSPHLALRSLQDRSLVKINKGKFEMHDQIRDMRREIVKRESPLDPENRSRLWHEGDVMEVLAKPQANMIEGIILNLHEGSETKLNTEAFELASKLRILHINFATFGDCDFRHFPASLKWLEWKGCPLGTLPLESKFKSIVVLDLSRSFISELWKEAATGSSSKSTKEWQLFGELKVLDLSCCEHLTATPNFAMAPNIEKLILDQCVSLKEVDDSIGTLKKLVYLSMRECVSLEKIPNEIYELSCLVVFNLEGCSRLVAFPHVIEGSDSITGLDPHGTPVVTLTPTSTTSKLVYINQTTSSDVTDSTIGLSNPEGLILRGCESLKFLPHLHKFVSLRSLHIDDCQSLNHKGEDLFEDVAFRRWDIEEVCISGSPTLPSQEVSLVLPFGRSLTDPLLLQQLQCHGYGDPCENRTMKLLVRLEYMTNGMVALETMQEVQCDYSISKEDSYGYCYTFRFGRYDRINEAPRGKSIVVKVTPCNDSELKMVDVKLQKRSKFSGESMEPFVSISRREAFLSPSRKTKLELSMFFNLLEEDKLIAIHYSTRLDDRIDNLIRRNCSDNEEQMQLSGWNIEELIMLTLIFSDINVSWYKLQHGTRLMPPQATAKVLNQIKVLDFSYCKFLIKTPDFAWIPHLEKLVLDYCECLLEVGESIGQLKNLTQLRIVGCIKLGALPRGILQLNSLRVLSIEKCSEIKILPEGSMMDVSLDTLEVLVLDECTSLIGIPDYVGQLRSLRRLSLRSCCSLKQLPDSVRSLEALQELILEGCTSITGIPYYVGALSSLRRLSLGGCPSLERLPDSIGNLMVLEEIMLDNYTSLARPPDSIVNLKSLTKMHATKCSLLKSMPNLSNLTALKELNVAGCKRLGNIPGLQKLRYLKVLNMKGCYYLDLHSVRLQLEEAAFQDLEAFTISTCWYTHIMPFPRRRRTSSNPLLLGKITVSIRSQQPLSCVLLEIKVAKDDVVYVFEATEAGENQYVVSFREDDEINKRLRVEAASGDGDVTRVGKLHISCTPPAWLRRADIWFRQFLTPQPET